MNSFLEKYKNVRCKLLAKQDHEPFAKVHFGMITAVDSAQKTITFSNGEQEKIIPFKHISALRAI